MTPTLTFAGHASVLIEHDGIGLLSDPWFRGTAFNDGWDLAVPAGLDDETRARVTDLWISHEHPDHFSVPTLLGFAAGESPPTVNFQKTHDHRVVDFCRAKGFPVREFQPHVPRSIGGGIEVTLGPHRHLDSWMLAEVGGLKVLNINDCSIVDQAQAQRVLRHTGEVDVLLTQFSYANWVGNPDEVQRRADYAQEILGYVTTQIEVLRPRWVIPFASFLRFCSTENAYLNDGLPDVGAVVDHIAATTAAVPIALFPGDRWRPGDDHDNDAVVRRYAEAEAANPLTPRPPGRTVTVDELVERSEVAAAKDRRLLSRAALATLARAGWLAPVRVHCTDLDEVLEVRAGHGARVVPVSPAEAHIAMSSDSLAFCFEQDFGAETLYVNGRYRVVQPPERLFFRHFYPAILRNQGFVFPIGAAQFLWQEKVAWRVGALRRPEAGTA